MTSPVDVVDEGPPRPASRVAAWGAGLVGLLVVGLLIVLSTADGDSGFARSPLISKAAPALSGETVTGEVFDIQAERGRWVVVNFFQTTCVPCVREHPELVAFEEARSAVGDAVVVSVAFSDSEANVREFFEENGGEWAVLAADTGRHAISYGVAAVPETFLISPAGVVTSKFIGGVTKAGLDAEIARLS